jgi:hypothetical protein
MEQYIAGAGGGARGGIRGDWRELLLQPHEKNFLDEVG